MTHEHLVKELRLDTELLCDFFLYFSRFEYALKRAGFIGGDNKRVEPAWDCFALSVRSKFGSVIDQEFKDAVDYLNDNPPKRQVIKCGQLDWADNRKDGSESREQ